MEYRERKRYELMKDKFSWLLLCVHVVLAITSFAVTAAAAASWGVHNCGC